MTIGGYWKRVETKTVWWQEHRPLTAAAPWPLLLLAGFPCLRAEDPGVRVRRLPLSETLRVWITYLFIPQDPDTQLSPPWSPIGPWPWSLAPWAWRPSWLL